MGADEANDVHKPHRKRQSGLKVEKKKSKNVHEQDLTPQQRNPKAFSFHSVNKVSRAVRRTLDVKEKKHHIPVVDRTPLEPPPVLIAVVGPPKVGKTTLISCLVKNFTRQRLSSMEGPVTIVSGKRRRLTIVECNNDINSMIDLAKVADLVLLLVDASFGFEMEIFEFLNICQVHGFPKIMGVLTHLDYFKTSKVLNKTKKRLKHRFWTEVYQGAKLFYLSGMINGEYQRTEIHNLGRFISVMKFRPLQWRTTHPYVLADRMEDVTNPEDIRQDPKCDRSVCLYGYVRGTYFRNGSQVHVPGCGDFAISDMSFLPDPCPLPEGEKKRRTLNEKERLIYAPMSGVGGIVYDKDAVYIDLGGSHSHSEKPKEENVANEFVSSLIETKTTIDDKMAASQLKLFTEAEPIIGEDVLEDRVMPEEEKVIYADGRVRRKAKFAVENTSDDDDAGSEEDDNADDDEGSENDDEADNDDDDDDDDDASKGSEVEDSFPMEITKGNSSLPFIDSDDDLEEKDLKTKSEDKKIISAKMSKNEKNNLNTKDKIIHTSMSNFHTKLDNTGDSSDEVSDAGSWDSHDEMSAGESDVDDSDSGVSEDDEDSGLEGVLTDKNEDDEMESCEDDNTDDKLSRTTTSKAASSQPESALKWKDNLALKASAAFLKRQQEAPNLQRLIYGEVVQTEVEEDEASEEFGGLFSVPRKKKKTDRSHINETDCSRYEIDNIMDNDLEEVMESIRDCFVTGSWAAADDAKTRLQQDDDMYGDFEDLETGEKSTGKFENDSDDVDSNAASDQEMGVIRESGWERKAQEKRHAKKKRLKAMFDSAYDDEGGSKATFFEQWKTEMDQQAQLNRDEFEEMDEASRAKYEGFRPGLYVRIQLDGIPSEFVTNFNATYPVILGGILSAEQNIGYVQVRLKRHRWFKKILKTRDPLILSLGWRRFQTVALYSIQDHNGRNRLLKYTPEHLHCHASFWGPITPQGTGVLAVQTVKNATPGFRISATGAVVELDKSMSIVKKLKLTGTPYKIFKKTAFIQGMFTSALEVAKFEGSSIRTVSGLRGQIKRALREGAPGSFRASFEDKIRMSDIIFVRTWCPVQVPHLYNPLTTLLVPSEERVAWQGMRTTGELRREKGIKRPAEIDSMYKEIKRPRKDYKELQIPRSLQRDLPFKDKPKNARNTTDVIQSKRPVIIRDAHEKKVSQLMNMVKTVHKDNMAQRKKAMVQRVRKHKKQVSIENQKRNVKQKEAKKEIYRSMGRLEKEKNKHLKD